MKEIYHSERDDRHAYVWFDGHMYYRIAYWFKWQPMMYVAWGPEIKNEYGQPMIANIRRPGGLDRGTGTEISFPRASFETFRRYVECPSAIFVELVL